MFCFLFELNEIKLRSCLFLQKDKTTLKKKNVVEDAEERELLSYLEKFTALISQAQQWLEMLNKSEVLFQQESINKDLVYFEHPRFENIKYHIFNKDVRHLLEYMIAKRNYALILAHIPYGF
jgi:hypothetical protein